MAVPVAVMAWLVEQAGSVALERAVGSLTAALGWPNPYEAESGPIADAKLLDELKEQLNCIEGRLDEDRLASLMAAFVQLETARDSRARDQLLADALGRFGEITGLPADGATAEVPNRLLHCWAYLGIASSHALLGNPQRLVAKALVDAANADRHTALPFVGREVIARLLTDEDFEVTDTFYAPIGSVAPTGAYMPGWARSSPTLASVAMLDLEVGMEAWRFTFDTRPYTDQGACAGASRRWEPSAAFDGDGVRVAITATNERMERSIEIRDAASGSLVGSREVNGLMVVQSIAEGNLVTGHDDGTVWRWSWSDAGLIERPEALCAVGRPIESIAVSWDGASLAVRDVSLPGTILVLRTVAAGLRVGLIRTSRRWTPVAFAGRYFFWTVPGMSLHVVDMDPAAPVKESVGELRTAAEELRSAGHVVRDLAVSPTERLLIALNSSGQASAWPVGDNRAPRDADRRPAPFALPGRTQYLLFSPSGPAIPFSQSDENKRGRGVYVRRVRAEEALGRGVLDVVDETR